MKSRARRHFIQHTLGLVPLGALVPGLLRQARASESCVDPASESLRESLHYQAAAPDPKKSCSKCGFFTPADPPKCGDCKIMSGPVDPTGHCDSWSEKS